MLGKHVFGTVPWSHGDHKFLETCGKQKKNFTISNVLTHSLLEILLKMRFHAICEVFWSLSGCKELKVIHFVALWSRCEMLSSGMHRKQKFEKKRKNLNRFKSDTAVLTFSFRLFSSPLFSRFLSHLVGIY